MNDLIIKNAICVFPNQTCKSLISIKNGKINKIIKSNNHQFDLAKLNDQQAKKVIDAKGLYLIPGVIDTQVHFRDPGFPNKETLKSGQQSALKGGVTCICDMPNTFPATIDCHQLEKKISTAAAHPIIDTYFFIGATADNLSQIIEAEKNPKCCGIKIFLGSSTGNLLLNDPQVLKSIFLNTTKPIAIHSEDEKILKDRISIRNNATNALSHPIWRNVESALSSTKMIINLAKETNRKIHILHISSKEEMEFLNKNKDICTVEVTPQHLSLSSPECYETLNTFAQMNPPIRNKIHQDALWKGIENNTVDVIGSDHAPHTINEKKKGYPLSPSGMPGVQTTLPIMLNHVANGKISLEKMTQLLCQNPAKLYNLKMMGSINEGNWANLNLIDLTKKWTISKDWISYTCGWSPFENMEITGQIIKTFYKGVSV